MNKISEKLSVTLIGKPDLFLAGLANVFIKNNIRASAWTKGVKSLNVVSEIRSEKCSYIFMDFSDNSSHLISEICLLRRKISNPKIIVLSSKESPRYIKSFLKIGVKGYILTSSKRDGLIGDVYLVSAGNTVCPLNLVG